MSNKDFAFGTSKYQIKSKAKALAKENGSNNWLRLYPKFCVNAEMR